MRCRQDERRIAHCGQIDEEHPVGEGVNQLAGDAQGQPGLASSARAGQAHQTGLGSWYKRVTVATSRSRPMSGVGGATRFVGWCGSERKSGNRSGNPGATTWKISSGWCRSRRAMLAEREQRHACGNIVRDQMLTASETRIWPP